jgi:hypothetical protein
VLRCTGCGTTFTAPAPEGVGEEKFDASADATIAVEKYGKGNPFHRTARSQAWHGVPLSESTQWDRVERLARDALPIFIHLLKLAASAPLLGSDDTSSRILSLMKENRFKKKDERTGIFTSCQMAWTEGHEIVLYSSGRRHSGENLERLLSSRGKGLDPPILMCDASSSNTSPAFAAIVANCLAHARGKFVAIESSFAAECRYVLDSLGMVYHNDDETSWMSPEHRLEYHKQHSKPVMDRLREQCSRTWTSDEWSRTRVLGAHTSTCSRGGSGSLDSSRYQALS